MIGVKSLKEHQEGRLAEASESLFNIQRLTELLDAAFCIPGTKIRIGVDSVIGLVPGVGDSVSAMLSSYLLYRGARLGVRKRTLLRMTMNLVIDATLGIIPIFGDIFDVAYKANIRNLHLIEEDLRRADRESRSRKGVSKFVAMAIGGITLGVILLALGLLLLVFSHIFSPLGFISKVFA
ncbi:DUF4112 domain-containing protein [bacterium]|nr:DUF4112 domain-containing protein [bacterium]